MKKLIFISGAAIRSAYQFFETSFDTEFEGITLDYLNYSDQWILIDRRT